MLALVGMVDNSQSEFNVVKFIIDLILGIIIAIAPSLPYISQYRIIKATGHAESFSHFLCATQLYGSAFRIFFW